MNMKVGFQGVDGAYSQLATLNFFGRDTESIGFASFDGIFDAVNRGEIDYGLIPVENSIGGSIVDNYDLLYHHDLVIAWEVYQKINHCLLAKHGLKLDDIKKAYSHPQALAQSREFLKSNSILEVPEYDTAGSAKIIAESAPDDAAAIASVLCAEIYDLSVVRQGIETSTTNTTRFFAICKKENLPKERSLEKTSLAFMTEHSPGSLINCLKIFSWYDINLSKLESRPIPDDPFEYVFYVDVESGIDDFKAAKALKELEERSVGLKVLGSYPKGVR